MSHRQPLAAIAVAAALALIAASGPAGAAEVKGAGTGTYTIRAIASHKLASGRKLRQSHLKGVLVAADPAHPFNLSTQDCNDVALIDIDGTVLKDYGVCAAVDKAGDVWWLKFEGKAGVGTWQVIGGIGKYEGMTGGGTTQDLLATPDGRLTLAWTGAVEMK